MMQLKTNMAYNTSQRHPAIQQHQRVKQIPKELRLEPEQVATIVSSVRRYYRIVDTPPADVIIVLPQSIQWDAEDPTYINASVRLVKDYCGEKSHRVNIRFQVNDNGVPIPKTIEYVSYV